MKQLMKGNEAVIHGALLGGATHFFGYPITPASEIAHAGADLFNKTGRHFLQAESEVAAFFSADELVSYFSPKRGSFDRGAALDLFGPGGDAGFDFLEHKSSLT